MDLGRCLASFASYQVAGYESDSRNGQIDEVPQADYTKEPDRSYDISCRPDSATFLESKSASQSASLRPLRDIVKESFRYTVVHPFGAKSSFLLDPS